MQSYIARNLEYEARNEKGTLETIILEDSQLLDIAQSKPIVILADAGMGKTELMKELVKPSHIKTKYLSASDLVQKSVKRLSIQADETLLIDAFDEIPSTKDSSGIDSVLNKLAELDYPKFILTCRSIEWNDSNKNEIQSDYKDILTVTLTNLSREDAQQFLQSRGLASENVSQLITQLEENSLSSFYENPRNLALLAEIDFSVHPVPETKAKLFELATEKLWQEINPKAQNALGRLHQQQVIECAGLIFAIYLLAGKQFIYKGMTGTTPDDAIDLHSLTDLINSETLESTIQSRLFQSVGADLFKPWHRSVAEYLGAKWVAKAMSNPIVRRHILSYLVIDNGVIASLRGLFAWLPTFNPNLSEIVIETDPYGLIEYGDTNYFSDTDSVLLFDALDKLTIKDPWFRKNNYWKEVKPEGLVSYSLLTKYKGLLSNKSCNSHFLKTILESLEEADFITELANELLAIVYDDSWYYFARFDAFTLLADNNLINTSADLSPLINIGSFDSLRLLFEYTNRYGFELLTDEQVVTAIMKSYNFERSDKIKDGSFFPQNGSEHYFLEYPVSRIVTLLKNIRSEILKLNIDKFNYDYDTNKNINSLILAVIRRYIEESNNPLDSSLFYQSITIFDDFKVNSLTEDNSVFFNNHFHDFPDKKLEVQQLLLDHSNATYIFYHFERSVLDALFPTSEDIKQLLMIFQNKPINKGNIKKWEIILNLSRTREGIDDDIYNLALPYAKKSQKRLTYLEEQRKSVIPEWEFERIQREEARKQEDKERHASYREFLSQNISQLEAGKTQYCVTPAEVLLNDHRDIPKELKPLDRLEYYLGKTLKESAIKGLRSGLGNLYPTANDIVDLRILEKKNYKSEVVLMAGIYCLLREEKRLDDLTDSVILSASVIYELSHYSHLNLDIDMGHAIKNQIIDRGLKNNLVNILIKPQFKAQTEVVNGLHWLEICEDSFTIETLTTLISNYEYTNNHYLYELISILSRHKALKDLRPVTKEKINDKDFKNCSKSKQSIWLALYSYFYSQDFVNIIKNFIGLKTEVFSEIESLYKTINAHLPLSVSSWVVKEYSNLYPNNNDPFSSAEFIKKCSSNISSNTSFEAQAELKKLKNCVHSSYTTFITNLLAEQANNIRDANYQAPMLADLLNIFQNKAPENCKDLRTLILELLAEIQSKVKSSELDTYKMFYEDGKNKNPRKPHDENYCRDRLADLLKPYIEPYQFRLDTEKDMPDDKRADLVCNSSEIQLPIEVKGQWHDDLWTAMNDQLGDLYLKEYQSQGQGIYLIFYFGENLVKRPKRNSKYKPQNAQELKESLTACIKEKYKEGIDVFVMDLSIEAT